MLYPLYVDVRSLQDPNYSFRGVGHHSAVILKFARQLVPEISEIIGIVDPDLNSLPDEYASFVDRIEGGFNPSPKVSRGIFLELSPMTHDLSRTVRFLNNPNILNVSLIYDFIPLDFDTERYLSNPKIKRLYQTSLQLIPYFDIYIPISNYSNFRLQHFCGVKPYDCVVSGVAIRKSFEIDLEKCHINNKILSFRSQKYFFAILGADSRKNPDVILKALALFNQESSQPYHLVILGSYPQNRIEHYQRLFTECGGNLNYLHFVYGLTDHEIKYLHAHSVCGISPSFIEGFSIPVVETVRCGSPILVSDIDAHRELIEDPDARFHPLDHIRLKNLMLRVAYDSVFRTQLLLQQSPICNRFTEEKVSRRAWNFIRSRFLVRSAPKLLRSKFHFPRLAILTPYPPERSGVADYTAQSLSEISKYAQVDVYTTCNNPRQDSWINAFYSISSAPYLSNNYDLILPVIGNSHFHIPALELHRHFGGPCLIHDNRLAELYAWWKGIDHFRNMAEKLLKKKFSIEECQSWLAQPWKLPSLFFEDILYRATPVVFHSKGIQRYVKKIYNIESEYLPFCCYRSFSEFELTPSYRSQSRKKLGLPDDRIIISTFGIVGQTKGSEECIWAVDILRSWGIQAELYFVGSIDKEYYSHLLPLVEKLNLIDNVHFFLDWISSEQYHDFVIASDYGIQLRSHGFGGLSGAMLDCISSGLPSVVNDDLAEALDSPDYIFRIPDQFSPILIAEQLYLAIQKGLHHNRLSPIRSDYVEAHSFKHYAKKFMKVFGID